MKINLSKLPPTWLWRFKKCGASFGSAHKATGISRSTISQLAHGHRDPSFETTTKIENFLAEHGEPFKLEYIQDD